MAADHEVGWRATPRLLRGSLRTLVSGQCLGQAADGLAQIAFAQFIVFEVGPGATPARITSILAVTLLPFSVVGPFAGVVIDRWSRRGVLVVMSWVRAALTLAAVATVVMRWEAAAYVGVLLLLSTSRFVLAAKGASLPRTVEREDLVTANAISSVAGMSAAFLGAVGGAAFVGYSATAGFVLACLLYLGAAATFARLPDVGGGDGRDMLRRVRQVFFDVRDGLRALGDPDIGRPLAAVWLHRLLLGAGFVLLVLVADSRFELGISGYGLALAVTGVSAFVGSVAAPVCARRWRPVALLPLAFLPPAAAVYVGGLAPNLVVLVAGLGVTALSFQLLKVLVDALVGGASPDVVRGRVFSVYDVLYNVAFVLAGLLMVPLWDPAEVTTLLWWVAAAFLIAWVLFARVFRAWPFANRVSPDETATTSTTAISSTGSTTSATAISSTTSTGSTGSTGSTSEITSTTGTGAATETGPAYGPVSTIPTTGISPAAGRWGPAAGRWGWRVVAMACGALPLLAFPGPAWWWFAWVSLVPLLLVIRAAPSSREAAFRGWWAGAGYIAAADHWVWAVAGPALVLLAFLLGFLWLPWGWAVRRMLAGRPATSTLLAATLVLPSGWVAIEAIRSWQSLGGPWALLGASQWNRPETLASAALGGVWLTGFLIVAVNVALTATLVTVGAGARLLLATAAAVALAVGPAWATVRPSLPVTARDVRVAVVQPGVLGDAETRLDREIRLSYAVAGERPELIVWGESSVGYDLESSPEVLARIVGLARRTGADVLVNVDARAPNGTIYKTSVLVKPDGVDGRYVKTRLVPFGEYVPMRRFLGWVTSFSDAAEIDRGRGTGPVVLHNRGIRVGPLICFESTFPDMARREVPLGAQLIVYQTSDSTFQGRWAQPQHASLTAVRAVETGRPAVQAALTGISTAFDATGNRLMWVTPGEQGAETLTLTLTGGRTPFDVAGEWVLALAAVVIAAALVGASLRSTGRPEEVGPQEGHAEEEPPERHPASVAD